MNYLVTGASGFIGKRLVRTLLMRPDATVHILLRPQSAQKLDVLRTFWGAAAERVRIVAGDLTAPGLGIAPADVSALGGRIDHLFHLGAVYDLAADPTIERATNIDGTREVVRLANAIGARCFHHISSIAAAGLYDGVFREDMFEEAERLDHPYFASKHEGERIVRAECAVPWRVYRPGMVVGDSTTGEMDKIDGPYYFFKPIQRLRRALPPWMPAVGLEGGRINLVPVDFVVRALDHLAHCAGLDGRCFHLTDPHPHRVGDLLGIFAAAAHAPPLSLRVNAALIGMIPKPILNGLTALTPVRRLRKALLEEFGLPDDILRFVNYPTRFDNRDAEALLRPAGITVPPLEDYAWRLWDYWERHLDPELFVDRSLKSRVQGRTVLVTGGSSGIGRAAALKLAEAGAVTLIVARDPEKLEATRQAAESRGLTLQTYSVDLTDAAQCRELASRLEAERGGVDILVNCAGRSIRRGIDASYDRLHDFDRMMRINYFGALNLTMGLLPGMAARKRGHVINISSIGVLTDAPRFSAYVASKAALEAWTRCAASEFLDCGVAFTTINMPLVRTPMIAPTKFYEHVPTLTPDEAADLIVQAIIHRPARLATRLGLYAQVLNAIMPRMWQIMMNTGFRMFPDSAAASGHAETPGEASPDQVAFAELLRGVHF